MIVSGSINSEPFGLRRKISVFLCISLCCSKAIQTCSNLLLHLLGLDSCSVIWSNQGDSPMTMGKWARCQAKATQAWSAEVRQQTAWNGFLSSQLDLPSPSEPTLSSPVFPWGLTLLHLLIQDPGGTSTSPQIQSFGFYLQNSNQ